MPATGGQILLHGEDATAAGPAGVPRLRAPGPDDLPGPVRVAEPRAHRALHADAQPQDPPRPAARRRARGRARRAARPRAAAPRAGATSTSSPTSSRAASASASPSPAPSRPTPRCCSPTSRSRCSTCRSASASSTCCATCATACTSRSSTSRTTSRRPATSPTARWSCTPAASSRAATRESVTQDPKHPYTQLLVRSAPDPDDLEARARGARGEAPSLVTPPERMPLQPALPVRHRPVPHRGAAAHGRRRGPRGRLLGLLRPTRTAPGRARRRSRPASTEVDAA